MPQISPSMYKPLQIYPRGGGGGLYLEITLK